MEEYPVIFWGGPTSWICLALGCLICMYVYRYATEPGKIWKALGVPSPPSAPFIGHMHRIYNPQTGFRGSIDTWTKQHGKIFGILFFRHPMLVVTDVEAAKQIVVSDFSNFSSRYGGPPGLYQPIIHKSILLNGGARWKRVRSVLSPGLSSAKLKLLTNHINTKALRLVEVLNGHLDSGVAPEAKLAFSAFSLDVLAGAAFGLELDCHGDLDGEFYQHAKSLVTFSKSVQLVIAALGVFPGLSSLFQMLNIGFFNSSDLRYFTNLFSRFISERRRSENTSNRSNSDSEKLENEKVSDFLHSMMNGEHFPPNKTDTENGSGKMEVDEIIAQNIIFVIAGYETTSATLQWLTYQLSKHADVQNKLRQEINDVIGDVKEGCDDITVTYDQCKRLEYTEAVIHETLRMFPPVVTLSRKARKATTVKGFPVPAGAAVIIPVYNICRDPEVFPDPHTFRPERFLTTNGKLLRSITSDFLTSLPFGFGPRQCLGYQLAILQVKIALVHIVKSFNVTGATPRDVEIDDFTALLIPKQPIRLSLARIDNTTRTSSGTERTGA